MEVVVTLQLAGLCGSRVCWGLEPECGVLAAFPFPARSARSADGDGEMPIPLPSPPSSLICADQEWEEAPLGWGMHRAVMWVTICPLGQWCHLHLCAVAHPGRKRNLSLLMI